MAAAVAGSRAPPLATTSQRWGDVDDDADDAAILPPPTTSGPDSRGIKTTVEYKRNDKGEIVRVTSRVRVVKVEKKLYKVSGGSWEGEALEEAAAARRRRRSKRGGKILLDRLLDRLALCWRCCELTSKASRRALSPRVQKKEKAKRCKNKNGRAKKKGGASLRSLFAVFFLSLSFDLLSLSTSTSIKLVLSFFPFPKTPQHQVVEERRHWPKFGDALNESATDSITVRANEEIPFERARAARQTTEERKASDMKSVLQGTDKSAIVGSLKDLLYKRRMERQLAAARGLISGPEMPPMEEDAGGGGGGGGGGLLPAAGAKGGYVPPSVRNRGAAGSSMGESMHRRGDDNSVRVTNLSEDTREDDLRVGDFFFRFFFFSFVFSGRGSLSLSTAAAASVPAASAAAPAAASSAPLEE